VIVEDAQSKRPPDPRALTYLHPRDSAAWRATCTVVVITAFGIELSLHGNLWAWVLGQLTLSIAFLQWFVILHEAGHKTLFRTRRWNRVIGHLAGAFALIPFHNWQRIHARHHLYTGWQDLDATTALLMPRPVRLIEKVTVNFAWRTGLPLFSILYRIQNFWNLPRITRYLPRSQDIYYAWGNALILGMAYVALGFLIGPAVIVNTVGIGLLLSLAIQDIVLLSQHTHMPTHLSSVEPVKVFPPLEQEPYTRSLLLPEWLSWLLLRFDFHELHHLYVQVPGYDLHAIPYRPHNEVNWLIWLRAAKRLSGTEFLFGRSEDTGFRL
jgi:acyl-lipid omega-6 desaturase (Delta-12 desaturase)